MLTDGNILLRPYSLGDREALVELANNFNVSKYLQNRFPYPYTLDSADSWIAMVGMDLEPHNFAIEWQGKFIGGIGLNPLADIHYQTAEIGYWLGEPFWGNGLATIATGIFICHVFSNLKFLRLQAMTIEENKPSARILEKNGFILEGKLNKHVTKYGRVYNALLYAKTRDNGM